MAGTVTIRFTFDQILASVAQETITVNFVAGGTGPAGANGPPGATGPTGPPGPGDMLKSVYDPDDDGRIANTQLNNMLANTFKGRALSTGIPVDMDVPTALSILNVESGATADQTNAEIRTAVEAATDSNVFTDADHTKLNALVGVAADVIGRAELKAELKATGVDLTTGTEVDWSLGIHFLKTMTGNTTLTFANIVEGKTITLEIDGNFTLTLPTGFDTADLTDFDGTKTNYIQIYCANSSTPIYLAGLKAR